MFTCIRFRNLKHQTTRKKENRKGICLFVCLLELLFVCLSLRCLLSLTALFQLYCGSSYTFSFLLRGTLTFTGYSSQATGCFLILLTTNQWLAVREGDVQAKREILHEE